MADLDFSDLIPQRQAPAPAPAGGGLSFDDLIPSGRNAASSGALHIRVGGPQPVAETGPAADQAGAPGQVEAGLRGARQGLTFGFGDELTGLERASGLPDVASRLLPPGATAAIGGAGMLAEYLAPGMFGHEGSDRYDQTVDAERARNTAASEANPATYLGGQLGGGVLGAVAAPAIAPLRAAQGANVLTRGLVGAGNLAAGGAVYGGVAGAGEAEGGVGGRALGAAQGAGIGAVAGPVVGAAIGGGRAVAGLARDHLRASGIGSPGAIADRVIGRALHDDAADLPAIASRMEVAGQQGQPLTLADSAGSNTLGLAGSVTRVPGPGRQASREFLDARQLGSETSPSQFDRISDQLGRTLSNKSAIETGEAILARRQKDADRMYEAAYKRPLDYNKHEGQELLSLIDRIPNSAKREANEILKVSDRQGHEFVWDPTPDAKGNYRLSAVPNGRHFQYIKEALDSAIQRERNPITGKLTTYGGAVQGLKTEILAKLDALSPAYRAARQTFAGHAELYDALRQGAEAFRPGTSPEAIRKAVSAMTPGEAEMYRLGAANALRESLANKGDAANKAAATYGNAAVRAKIAALAPDQASRKAFDTFLRNEQDMARTFAQTGGSPTAGRGVDDQHAGEMIAHGTKAAAEVVTGHIPAAIRSVFEMMKKVSPEHRGKVMGEVRKVLFDPNPETVRAVMARIEAADMKAGTRDRIVATIVKALPPELVEQASAGSRHKTGASR